VSTFITIGYGDRDGYDSTDADVRDAAHRHDESLRAAGVVMGSVGEPVQVRNHDGVEVIVKDGQFLRSDLPIAGFALIDAVDLEEAIRLVSETPCAVAYGVVEVWPLLSTP
jgi:hypothetical protein